MWCIAATALVLAWFVRGRVRDRVMWSCAAGLAVWWAVGWGLHWRSERARLLRVDMLSVGDGSCLVLRSGGKTALWDAGSLRAGMGADTIARALTAMDIARVDAVFITHPDIDHFGGLPPLVRSFGIERVYTCERFVSQSRSEPRGAAAALVGRLGEEGCVIETLGAGARREFGACSVEILSPPLPEPGWEVDNEHSLIAVVKSGEREMMMLTGDAQQHAIETALARGPRPEAMEVPHHGAFSAAAEKLVRETGVKVVLQSTSQRREHTPKWDAAKGSVGTWLVTSRDGAVWVEFGAGGAIATGTFRR